MSEEDNSENFSHNEHQSEGEQRRDETRAGVGGAKSLASVQQLQRRASVVKSSAFCQQLFAARIQIKLSLYE